MSKCAGMWMLEQVADSGILPSCHPPQEQRERQPHYNWLPTHCCHPCSGLTCVPTWQQETGCRPDHHQRWTCPALAHRETPPPVGLRLLPTFCHINLDSARDLSPNALSCVATVSNIINPSFWRSWHNFPLHQRAPVQPHNLWARYQAKQMPKPKGIKLSYMEQEANIKPFQASHRWGNPLPATYVSPRSLWGHAHIAFQRSCLKPLLRQNPTKRTRASQTLFLKCRMYFLISPQLHAPHNTTIKLANTTMLQHYDKFAAPKRLYLKIIAGLHPLGCFTPTS